MDIKKIIVIINILIYYNATAQVTVADRRSNKDTVPKPDNVSVIDHRSTLDMNTAYVQPLFENMPVFRIQLRLTTGRGEGAATDDKVYVNMKGDLFSWPSEFKLNKPGNNFKQGNTQTHDIITAEIRFVRDIQKIELGITGNDGVCFTKVELLLNNCATPVFSTGESPDPRGICIDNNSNEKKIYTITYDQLRKSSTWNYLGSRKNMWRPPAVIKKEWLVSLIEASVGNYILPEISSGLKWGTDGNLLENDTRFGNEVELDTMRVSYLLNADLDLEAIESFAPNKEFDVKFLIKALCQNNVLKIYVDRIVGEIYRETGNTKKRLLLRGAIGLADEALEPGERQSWYSLYSMFVGYRPYFLTGFNSQKSCTCNRAVFNDKGDLLLK